MRRLARRVRDMRPPRRALVAAAAAGMLIVVVLVGLLGGGRDRRRGDAARPGAGAAARTPQQPSAPPPAPDADGAPPAVDFGPRRRVGAVRLTPNPATDRHRAALAREESRAVETASAWVEAAWCDAARRAAPPDPSQLGTLATDAFADRLAGTHSFDARSLWAAGLGPRDVRVGFCAYAVASDRLSLRGRGFHPFARRDSTGRLLGFDVPVAVELSWTTLTDGAPPSARHRFFITMLRLDVVDRRLRVADARVEVSWEASRAALGPAYVHGPTDFDVPTGAAGVELLGPADRIVEQGETRPEPVLPAVPDVPDELD